MPDERAYLKDRHLRLTLQLDGDKSTVLDMDVIEEPLPEPGRVAGPFIMSVDFRGGLAWLDTMQDPFEQRGMPRRGERGHFYEMKSSAIVVARVPIPKGSMPNDFRISFARLSGAIPEKMQDLEKIVAQIPHPPEFKHIATVPLSMIKKHPEWNKIVQLLP